MNKLKREYQFFKQQTSNVRVLLMTNLLYAFVLPVVEIWVAITDIVAAALPAAPVSDSGVMASAKAVSSTRLVSSGWMVMLWKRLAM